MAKEPKAIHSFCGLKSTIASESAKNIRDKNSITFPLRSIFERNFKISIDKNSLNK